jgi:Coenzyme PQQ synthesis protein D (PqqD)
MDGRDGPTQDSHRIRRLEPTEDVVGQRLGDEVVLVSLHTNRIFELNRTGGRFWELLQSENDRARIEQRLLEEFDVSQEELSAELDRLIKSLADEELVRILEDD